MRKNRQTMHHYFIVNPIAGSIKADFVVSCLKEILEADFPNIEYTISITDYIWHASKLSALAASTYEDVRIYSLGGDGTLNEVANGIRESDNEKAVLVPVPLGSGNDFVRSLGYVTQKDVKKLLLSALNSLCVELDICMVNGRYFINISSVGFDAEVAVKANFYKENNKLIPKGLAYYVAVFTTFLKMKSYAVSITIDNDQVIERDVTLMAVANGKYYGGGIMPVPDASPSDGYIDVCILNRISRILVPFVFPLYIKGKHSKLKVAEFYRCKNVKIISKGQALNINIDGEFSTSNDVEFNICEGKILVGQLQ